MAKKAQQVFTLTMDGQERFSFHAVDMADAERKAFNWQYRHGLTFSDMRVTIEPGTGRFGDIQDSWVS